MLKGEFSPGKQPLVFHYPQFALLRISMFQQEECWFWTLDFTME